MAANRRFLAALATALLFTGSVASAAGDGILAQLKCGPNFDRPQAFNVVFKLQGEDAPKLIDEAAEVVTVAKIVARGVG